MRTMNEWQYTYFDRATNQAVNSEWRPRPEGVSLYQLHEVAKSEVANPADLHGCRSRPVQVEATK